MDCLSPSFLQSTLKTKVSNSLLGNVHSLSLLPQIYISSKYVEEEPSTFIHPSPTLNNKIQKSSSTATSPSSHVVKTSHFKNNTLQPNTVSIMRDEKQPLLSLIKPRPATDSRFLLSGNFAPVEELPPTECEVEDGVVLPSCLNGAYIRNGPNPQFLPQGPHHLFDGDGMLHSIRISNGKVTFCSRYVKTYKHIIEHDAGFNIIPNFISGSGDFIGFVVQCLIVFARVITWQLNLFNGIGVANTSLAFFGNKLYALGESDLPYEVKITPNGNIKTVGRNNFNGKLRARMTAHPKVDPTTGETFAFRYGLTHPFVTYFRFDCKGNKHEDVPISSIKSPSFLHDFVITKKFAIFPVSQFKMDVAGMTMKGGSIMGFDPTKVSRIGVIPKYASDASNMKWFDVPGFNILHAINAWDEVDKDGNESIVIVAPNIISAEHTIERMDLIHPIVEMTRIDLSTRVVTRQPLSTRNLEFGVINPKYVGRKNRYVYAAIGDPLPRMAGVVKLDLSIVHDRRESVVAIRMFGQGCYGGEPFFVATNPDDTDADEDEGYLVSYVHDDNTNESRFVVFDAKSPSLDVVASVKLPQRVPYGFHGLFVREKDLHHSQE